MTPLAGEIFRILRDEAAYPPKSAAMMVKILKFTGYPHGPAGLPEVEAALREILIAGEIERIWRRGAAHYRVIQTPPPVAARETDRPLP